MKEKIKDTEQDIDGGGIGIGKRTPKKKTINYIAIVIAVILITVALIIIL